MSSLFSLDHVSLRAGDTVVLDDITLELPDRGITVLVGRSGSGKSSMLRLLNRLSVPTHGTVSYRGSDVGGLDPQTLRRRVAMIFQRPTVLGDTALDDIRIADPELSEPAAAALCERVHLDPALLDRSTAVLSGGEAQRLCVARALATQPDVLLADEPTSALDHETTTGMESLARELAANGIPVVWVTHDRAQVRRIANHAVVLDRGQVIASGSPDALLDGDDSRVLRALDDSATDRAGEEGGDDGTYDGPPLGGTTDGPE